MIPGCGLDTLIYAVFEPLCLCIIQYTRALQTADSIKCSVSRGLDGRLDLRQEWPFRGRKDWPKRIVMTDDLRITQLLCSRLCHDLVGPVGAINNGIELIEDAPDMIEDSLSLLNNSANQASRRLAFYRAAFGFGGGDGPGALKEVRVICQDFVADGQVTIDWPDESVVITLPKNGVKLVMNLILLGVGTLIRGGQVSVKIAEEGGGAKVIVSAAGQGAKLQDDLKAAMATDYPVADLTAHTVQAHFTTRLAQSVGSKVALTENSNEVSFAAVISTS